VRILLTGATGFLGQELYTHLKASNHEVVGLSRHGPDRQADILEPNLGYKRSPHLDMVIHSAAFLSFSEKDQKVLHSVNSEGTLNVCNFCLENRIPRLVYISTAYVCGDFKGTWREDHFSEGQHFKNPYESSKFWGESYVREFARGFAGFHPPIKVTIFRPGIIVGRSTDGKASTFGGFYKPVEAIARVMWLMEKKLRLPPREVAERWLHLPGLRVPLALKGDPDSTLNLVPVDWVAQKVVDLLGREGTFHLTNPHPLTNSTIISGINEALGISGPHFDSHARLLQPHDRLWARMTKDFFPYMQYEPTFQSTVNRSLSLTRINRGFIIKTVGYWRGQGGNFGKRNNPPDSSGRASPALEYGNQVD